MPLIECYNLTKIFRGERELRAVDGVSLTVNASETLGLVGESGCGKTTLGRCLIGLTQPSSGSVIFDGEPVESATGSRLRKLCRKRQIVFQDPFASLDPRWRIGAILDEPLRVHNIVPQSERRGEIARLLNDVGLEADVIHHFPHEFSGGQRQRIGIARALSVRPKFLIADEPVSALDVSVRAQILNVLARLQAERGFGQLFITHDLGAVKHVSDRIAVMYRGSIVEEAETGELFENPRHPYTRMLLDAVPRIGNVARSTSTGPDTDDAYGADDGRGCKFQSRCVFAQQHCGETAPALNAIGGTGHRSACHFADTLPVYTLSTDTPIQNYFPERL